MTPINDFENYKISDSGEVFNTRTQKFLRSATNKQNGYLYISLYKNGVGSTFLVHRLVAIAYIPNPENKPFVNHKNSIRADATKENLEWCTQSENIQHGYDFGFMTQEARKNFKDFELELILNSVLAGEDLTAIALQKEVGLSRLSINIRKYAEQVNLLSEYEASLKEQKRVRNTEANASKKQAILQFTKDLVLLGEHESLHSAAKSLGKTSGSISNALNPNFKQHTAYGFIWKFK